MRVVLIAAERSGARLAALLAAELDDAVVLHRELAAVGPVEALALVPRAMAHLTRLERQVMALEPRVVVTIDAPTLHLRLAARLRQRGIRVAHWVSPQIWAWRPYRRHRIAASVDVLGCLLPFEPALYRDTGLRAQFTGHPAATAPRSPRPLAVGVAAGSRAGERARLGPVFAAAARQLGIPVLEAVPPGLRPCCPEAERVDDVRELAQRVSAALVCSGTATLELAAAGVPMVAAYAMHPLSWGVARSFVGLTTAALPNLVLGRRLVPELFQQVEPAELVRRIDPMFGPAGEQTSDALVEVGAVLRGGRAAASMAGLVVDLGLTD